MYHATYIQYVCMYICMYNHAIDPLTPSLAKWCSSGIMIVMEPGDGLNEREDSTNVTDH